jgi:ATP-binding cassette subfamily B protein
MSQPTSTRRARSFPSEGSVADGDRRKSGPFPELLAGDRRRGFAALIAAGIGQGAALGGMTFLMKAGLDRALAHPSADGAALSAPVIFAGLAIAAGAAGFLKWFAHVEAERIGQSYAHALRMRLFRRLVAAGEQPRKKRGAILLRISGDLTPLRQWVSRGISQLIVSGLATTLGLSALAWINAAIAAAVALTLLFAAFASLLISRKLERSTADARRRRGKLAKQTGETISEADAFMEGRPAREARRLLRRSSRKVRDALLGRAVYAGALRAVAESAGAFAGVAAIVVGVGLTARADLSPGAVMSAVFIAGALAPHAHAMSRALEYWTAAQVARKKQIYLYDRLAPARK